jgi:2'-5' RNA ligase
MAEKETILTYWLIPAEPERNYFRTLIGNLAVQFDAVGFEPHVTVYVTRSNKEDPNAVLSQVLKHRGEYRLFLRGLDYSDEFTKTLFVQFEPDAEVTHLSSDLRRASAVQNDYELNPHLSLIYKTMAHETKRELARSTRLPFTEVRFDSVKVVISPANIKTREDVETWRVVAEQKLTE